MGSSTCVFSCGKGCGCTGGVGYCGASAGLPTVGREAAVVLVCGEVGRRLVLNGGGGLGCRSGCGSGPTGRGEGWIAVGVGSDRTGGGVD